MKMCSADTYSDNSVSVATRVVTCEGEEDHLPLPPSFFSQCILLTYCSSHDLRAAEEEWERLVVKYAPFTMVYNTLAQGLAHFHF